MSKVSYRLILLTVLGAVTAPDAIAQEFRIYTRVYNEGAASDERSSGSKGERAPVIARSLSLFHAGKVYDYIDTVGEVIIFEPAHHRFTVFSTTRSMAAYVDFDELKHLLKVARHETEQYLVQLERQGSPNWRQVAAPLRFQLEPQFDEHYHPEKHVLLLASRHWRYRAKCAEVESPEVIDVYLRYADWMARLNYVLHPQAFFPEPRLALNEGLRRHRKMPVEVALEAEIDGLLKLRAQHQIHWKLDSQDRSLIHRWESLLKSKNTQFVTFREYQRALLAEQTTKR